MIELVDDDVVVVVVGIGGTEVAPVNRVGFGELVTKIIEALRVCVPFPGVFVGVTDRVEICVVVDGCDCV